MTKLDEIQERIRSYEDNWYSVGGSHAVAALLNDIVSELKRIDAEQTQIKAILPPSWNKGPQ